MNGILNCIQERSDRFASRARLQNRMIPSRKSSATVIAPELSSEPRHPSRFENKKNMRCPV